VARARFRRGGACLLLRLAGNKESGRQVGHPPSARSNGSVPYPLNFVATAPVRLFDSAGAQGDSQQTGKGGQDVEIGSPPVVTHVERGILR
jgi:hypothetical protein